MDSIMKERPILFNAEMVKAILAGNKTQTRRVMKTQIVFGDAIEGFPPLWHLPTGPESGILYPNGKDQIHAMCPLGKVGDRLIPAVPLPGYDKRYCADVFGNVWSRAKGEWRRLAPSITSKGYSTITPARNGNYATKLVHRLVCEAFYGAAPDGFNQVRHLNGDKSNNAPENLDWGTQEQNWADRAAHGGGMGESHHAAKLSSNDVLSIRTSTAPQRTLAAQYGVSQSTIQSARSGEIWAQGLEPAPVNMPRWASRITLEITAVRVERLQSISEQDARGEGCEASGWMPSYSNPDNAGFDESLSAADNFCGLWESIYGTESWAKNPWVWVIEFKKVTP